MPLFLSIFLSERTRTRWPLVASPKTTDEGSVEGMDRSLTAEPVTVAMPESADTNLP